MIFKQNKKNQFAILENDTKYKNQNIEVILLFNTVFFYKQPVNLREFGKVLLRKEKKRKARTANLSKYVNFFFFFFFMWVRWVCGGKTKGRVINAIHPL